MVGTFYLQSSYSMLKNMINIESLIEACKDNNYEFIALSDESLHGLISFFESVKKTNLKPIVGINVKVFEPFTTEFLIYVKNQTGYLNLLEIVNLKNNNNKLSLDDLIMRENGLIFVSSGNSIIDSLVNNNSINEAESFIKDYQKYFSDFYLGLNFNNSDTYKENIVALSNKYQVDLVLVNKTAYLNSNDQAAYETLLAISGDGDQIGGKFLSEAAVKTALNLYPKLKTGHNKLVSSVNFKLTFPKYTMPKFKTPNNVSEEVYLESLAKMGLKKRLEISGITNDEGYKERLERELKVIIGMNFARYFLIVYDFVKYAKQNDVLVGPGRGSAAGSLVAYCLGITNIDPIEYNLMFERFLNPARITMPDIDLDFPDNKRDDVINYVKEKYGENHICSITTFNTFAVNSSIRDIARVIDFPQERITGVINSFRNNTIDPSDLEVKRLLEIAEKIKGLPRHTGTHPAGIILANEDLTKSIPMQQGAFSFNQSVFEASDLEQLGLIKIDFLGIKNLTIIDDILKIINTPKKVLDINKIPLDNKKTYQLLASGNTTGIFQLESSGMRRVLRNLKPTNFEDIVAVLALFRPGPMDNIDEFIKRRHGASFEYLHKDLEPTLKNTYGIIVYQEQIMQIAQTFAGYDLFEADMLRVGVSKKDKDILENEKVKFIKGAVNNNYSETIANEIYELILKFANYGFNRSHSVAYSLIAYQMAYLKANYYNVFMSVLLSHVTGNLSQTNSYISEAISNGLNVYPPNLNLSRSTYVPYQKGILMPLTQIKGIGAKTYEKIKEVRNNGKFKDFAETKQRLNNVISQSEFVSLIYAGALDFTNLNKKTLVANSDFSDILYASYVDDVKINEVEDFSYIENMENELAVIGTNLTYSIQQLYEHPKLKGKVYPIKIAKSRKGSPTILGVIKKSKVINTKRGDKMAFITISDGFDELEITIFPDLYDKYLAIDQKALLLLTVVSSKYQNEMRYNLKTINLLKID